LIPAVGSSTYPSKDDPLKEKGREEKESGGRRKIMND
jgi:hypothetical protein